MNPDDERVAKPGILGAAIIILIFFLVLLLFGSADDEGQAVEVGYLSSGEPYATRLPPQTGAGKLDSLIYG